MRSVMNSNIQKGFTLEKGNSFIAPDFSNMVLNRFRECESGAKTYTSPEIEEVFKNRATNEEKIL